VKDIFEETAAYQDKLATSRPVYCEWAGKLARTADTFCEFCGRTDHPVASDPLYQIGDHALFTATDEEVEIVGRVYAVLAQQWVYVTRVGTVDRSMVEWELADLRRPTDPLPRQATGQNRQDMEWTSRQLGDSRDV
jgi:hypothetical protein